MQYDPESGEGGLFVEYIDRFLNLKAEAIGYPGWVHSPEDEDRYVDSFWQRESITLPNGVWPNSVSTPCGANCGEKRSKMTKLITEPKDLYGFLATPGV